MKFPSYSRRAFLQSLGASAAFVPLLDARRVSAATAFPKRIILVTTPNGVLQDNYWPTGTETNFNFPVGTADIPGITAPLNALKGDIIAVRGINMKSAADDKDVGGAHDNFPHMFAGIKLGPGKVAGGPTLDQFLADKLNPPTKIKSLVAAVMVQWGDKNQARISWNGTGNAITPEESPLNLFKTLFGGGFKPMGQTDTIEKLFQERRSVLDVVGRDLERFKARLGSDDQQKLASHINSIAELERRLDPKYAVNATCNQPVISDANSKMDVQSIPNYPQVGQLHMDMIVESFACDLTRIATLQWSNAAANQVIFSWLGTEFTAGATKDAAGRPEFNSVHNHHEITHHGSTLRSLKSKIENWYHQQLAYLIQKLKSKKEGSGTLLDNTIVLWANNMHDGAAHSHGPHLPWILAGSAGGYFKPGRYIDLSAAPVPHNRLLMSLAGAMGVDVTSYGDPQYCVAGPLNQLRG